MPKIDTRKCFTEYCVSVGATMKCLNEKCDYTDLHSYDCVCPKCGMDLYYKFHYGLDAFPGKRENDKPQGA